MPYRRIPVRESEFGLSRAITRIGKLLASACVGLTTLDAGAAQPVRIDLTGEVTASDLFTLVPGDPVSVSLYVDAQTSDENPTPGEFAATLPGTFAYQFKTFPMATGDILEISADASSGDWSGELFDPTAGGPTEIAIALDGVGLASDQILPNYASLTSSTGFWEIVGGPLAFATTEVEFHSVEIVPIVIQVPALGAAGRSGLAALLLLLVLVRFGRGARVCCRLRDASAEQRTMTRSTARHGASRSTAARCIHPGSGPTSMP